MAQDCKKIVIFFGMIFLIALFWSRSVQAAPYFYIYGTSSASAGISQTWLVGLFTDGERLTAAQTVISFDEGLFSNIQLSNLDSKCSFWAPGDPTLGYGNGTSPYISSDNKVVISCGFSNPGYISTNGVGDLILSMTLKPFTVGMGNFSFSNTQLRYIGNTVIPGVSQPYDFSIDWAATPSVTPTPAPTPTPTPVVETLKLSDLQSVNIDRSGSRSASRTSGSSSSNQGTSASQSANSPLNNIIPPPPADLPLRAKVTPNPAMVATPSAINDTGEVLSLQSLQELLIPGKSQADRTLVLFNFVMTITFLSLLAILIWRLVMSRRSNKLKYKHMNEILEGELAVIESKIAGIKQGTVSGEEVAHSFEDLKKELESKI